MDLVLRRSTVGSVVVVTAAGEIDLATVPQLRNALQDAILQASGSTVAVDLDGVSACDDTGYGILLGAAARARDAGGDLVLVTSDDRTVARLQRLRLDRAIDIRPSLAAVTA